MSSSTKPVNTTTLIWWDLDTIQGDLDDVGAFVGHLKNGIKHRFNLGELSRFRTSVFHQVPIDCQVRAALPDDADVIHTGPNKTVSQTVLRKAKELFEDWRPNEVIVWAVTCDPRFMDVVRAVRQRGYNIFLVSDFTKLSKSTFLLPWLEIYSYYVIAHGDLRKLRGRKISRPTSTQHRTLGFKSPIMLTELKLRQPNAELLPKPSIPMDPVIARPVPVRLVAWQLLNDPTTAEISAPFLSPSPSPTPSPIDSPPQQHRSPIDPRQQLHEFTHPYSTTPEFPLFY